MSGAREPRCAEANHEMFPDIMIVFFTERSTTAFPGLESIRSATPSRPVPLPSSAASRRTTTSGRSRCTEAHVWRGICECVIAPL